MIEFKSRQITYRLYTLKAEFLKKMLHVFTGVQYDVDTVRFQHLV